MLEVLHMPGLALTQQFWPCQKMQSSEREGSSDLNYNHSSILIFFRSGLYFGCWGWQIDFWLLNSWIEHHCKSATALSPRGEKELHISFYHHFYLEETQLSKSPEYAYTSCMAFSVLTSSIKGKYGCLPSTEDGEAEDEFAFCTSLGTLHWNPTCCCVNRSSPYD